MEDAIEQNTRTNGLIPPLGVYSHGLDHSSVPCNCITVSIANIVSGLNQKMQEIIGKSQCAEHPSISKWFNKRTNSLSVTSYVNNDYRVVCPLYWYVVAWQHLVKIPKEIAVTALLEEGLPTNLWDGEDPDAAFDKLVRNYFETESLRKLNRAVTSTPGFDTGANNSRRTSTADLGGMQNTSEESVIDEEDEEAARLKAEERTRKQEQRKSVLEKIQKDRETCTSVVLELAKTEILKQLSDKCTQEDYFLQPVLMSMLGYVNYRLKNYEAALRAYSFGGLVNQKRVMYCIAVKFCADFFEDSAPQAKHIEGAVDSPDAPTLVKQKLPAAPIKKFLLWANTHGSIVALQAYRLLVELMHKRVVERLADAVLDENTGLNKKKVAISFPRVNMQSLMKKKKGKTDGGANPADGENGDGDTRIVEEEGLKKGLTSGALSKARFYYYLL